MKALNQQQILPTQLTMMNKPKKHKSLIIQRLQAKRSSLDFEVTKKRMMLSAKIADAIKAKGWSKKEFSEAVDQYQSVITKWLSGTHHFTDDTLFEIERVLGIELFSYKDKQPTVIKQFVMVLQDNSVAMDLTGSDKISIYKKLIHFTAKPLQKNQKIALPVTNFHYEC